MPFHLALRRADARLSALFFYVAYTVAATVAVWLITGAGDSLSTLGFGFGPKIALVAAGEPLGDATDLPFVPYFLGLLARFWDDPLFVALVKNLVFQALPAYVLVRLWSCAARGWLTPALLVYVLTFPQLVRHGFGLVPEEAYLIPIFAFVFWGWSRRGRVGHCGAWRLMQRFRRCRSWSRMGRSWLAQRWRWPTASRRAAIGCCGCFWVCWPSR
jgi:hypothetical protein